jgi:hypothetical protein
MSGTATARQAKQPDVAPEIFYRRVMELLGDARIAYLIGGTHALAHQTGLPYDARDFDVLIRREEIPRVRRALAAGGYELVMAHPHFVAKVYEGDGFVDLIFGSGNGLTDLDDDWFAHASWGRSFGVPVRFCAPEDLLWSKAFIMERERYDGADVAHLILTCGDRMDWRRILDRFGPHWRVLLAHLIMFGFAYPARRSIVPAWLSDELLSRLASDSMESSGVDDVCQGTLVSRRQYLFDLQNLGMKDPRLEPDGPLTEDEVAHWTAAALEEARKARQ